MKKIIVIALLFAGMAAINKVQAQDYRTALGVRLSSAPGDVNNSISFKQFITDKTAIEVLFSFGDPLALGALAEFHKPLASAGLSWFYGAGGYLAFKKTYNVAKQKDITEPTIGAQGIIGLDYKFTGIPLNLSLDWKPELSLVSNINFEPAVVGFTARFTFGK